MYADVKPSETPASELTGRKGIIISGGPSSVYDPGSPTISSIVAAPRSFVVTGYGQGSSVGESNRCDADMDTPDQAGRSGSTGVDTQVTAGGTLIRRYGH